MNFAGANDPLARLFLYSQFRLLSSSSHLVARRLASGVIGFENSWETQFKFLPLYLRTWESVLCFPIERSEHCSVSKKYEPPRADNIIAMISFWPADC